MTKGNPSKKTLATILKAKVVKITIDTGEDGILTSPKENIEMETPNQEIKYQANVVQEIYENLERLEHLDRREANIIKQISDLDTELRELRGQRENIHTTVMDYTKVQYTQDFLRELIQNEPLDSKRKNYERILEDVMKNNLTVETALELIRMDKQFQDELKKQDPESKLAKMYRYITEWGE